MTKGSIARVYGIILEIAMLNKLYKKSAKNALFLIRVVIGCMSSVWKLFFLGAIRQDVVKILTLNSRCDLTKFSSMEKHISNSKFKHAFLIERKPKQTKK